MYSRAGVRDVDVAEDGGEGDGGAEEPAAEGFNKGGVD